MKLHRLIVVVLLFLNLCYFSIINGKNTGPTSVCDIQDLEGDTLNVLSEQTIANSFRDFTDSNPTTYIPPHFEASDVILRTDGQMMYVVFDNTFQIGAFCTSTTGTRNCVDRILNWPDASVRDQDSTFEGIAYNSLADTYFIVQEAIPSVDDKHKFQPNVFEVRIQTENSSSNIQILESCRVEMEFDADNKGFEGLEFVVHEKEGENYLLGLCEANKCRSSLADNLQDNDLGEGRVIVLKKKEATKKNPCIWSYVDKIKLPSAIQFLDYSSMSIYRGRSPEFPTYVAITSQENSQVWIGVIEEIKKSPFFEISLLDKNLIYNLPRATGTSLECPIQYCTLEGVAWRNSSQLILVSDKTKDRYAKICKEKDESIHFVQLPDKLTGKKLRQ